MAGHNSQGHPQQVVKHTGAFTSNSLGSWHTASQSPSIVPEASAPTAKAPRWSITFKQWEERELSSRSLTAPCRKTITVTVLFRDNYQEHRDQRRGAELGLCHVSNFMLSRQSFDSAINYPETPKSCHFDRLTSYKTVDLSIQQHVIKADKKSKLCSQNWTPTTFMPNTYHLQALTKWQTLLYVLYQYQVIKFSPLDNLTRLGQS